MEQTSMFPDLRQGFERESVGATRPQEVRVVRPVRDQVQFVMQDLDAGRINQTQSSHQ